MLRIILSITRIVLVAITALLFASCNFGGRTIVGSGNVVSKTRTIAEEFTKISAQNGIEVIVLQGEPVSVVVEADDNLEPHITTRVEGKTLVIECDFNSFTDISEKKVTVKMPKIEGLEAESGAELKSQGSLRCASVELATSSGADLDVEVEAEDVQAESSSGSQLKVRGKAMNFDSSSSSGSSLSADGLRANEVSAQASSGSTITVYPILKLDGEASSGGSVHYANTPKSLNRTENSGGSVSGS